MTQNRLTFAVTPDDNWFSPATVTPLIDGESLVALIAGFEQRRGFSPAGEYSGLIPAYFNFGQLSSYFLGKESRQWPKPDHLWLLGCECGEVGCWPLTARVILLNDTVTWTEFAQDYRPEWNYAGFGPFVFERDQYERAVRWLVSELA